MPHGSLVVRILAILTDINQFVQQTGSNIKFPKEPQMAVIAAKNCLRPGSKKHEQRRIHFAYRGE
jgi:hypothetical protein